MNNHKSGFARVASLALALSLLAAPLSLPAVDGTLTIVTSYPKDTTGTFKKAFEKKYPSVKVEMLKKKTTAVQGLADAGQARPDARVVRYLAVRQRHVQIQAHEHALAAQIDLGHCDYRYHFPHSHFIRPAG